jgi:hypothetical protein
MVAANTRPAAVTTPPVLVIARMMPAFSPAPISSLNREVSSRLVGYDLQEQDDGSASTIEYN